MYFKIKMTAMVGFANIHGADNDYINVDTIQYPIAHHEWAAIEQGKNGIFHITQRAAEAVYTPEGKSQKREIMDYYISIGFNK